MRRMGLVLIGFLAACRTDEWDFQREIVLAECEWALACYSDPILTFYGWWSVPDCVSDQQGAYAAEVSGCVYDASAAKACIKELEALPGCTDGDPEWPAVCEQAYTSCTGATAQDTGP